MKLLINASRLENHYHFGWIEIGQNGDNKLIPLFIDFGINFIALTVEEEIF